MLLTAGSINLLSIVCSKLLFPSHLDVFKIKLHIPVKKVQLILTKGKIS